MYIKISSVLHILKPNKHKIKPYTWSINCDGGLSRSGDNVLLLKIKKY